MADLSGQAWLARRRLFARAHAPVAMNDDPIDYDRLYRTVRRGIRDGLREVLGDVLTVVVAFLLFALGVPLVFASARGGGPAAWVGVAVGVFIMALGGYRLYARFAR